MNYYGLNIRGASSIPLVLTLGFLFVAYAGVISDRTVTRLREDSRLRRHDTVERYIRSGLDDALLQLARNRDLGLVRTEYRLPMLERGCVTGEGCAIVTFRGGAGSTSSPRVVDITGVVKGYKRTSTRNIVFDSDGRGLVRLEE